MIMRNLHDMYTVGLQELCGAEAMLVEMLPKMAAAASHRELRTAFESYFEETRLHIQRVDRILAVRHADPNAPSDAAMRILIDTAERMIRLVPDFIPSGCLSDRFGATPPAS